MNPQYQYLSPQLAPPAKDNTMMFVIISLVFISFFALSVFGSFLSVTLGAGGYYFYSQEDEEDEDELEEDELEEE